MAYFLQLSRQPLIRIKFWTAFFIAGLFFSGVTAIPLQPEIHFLVQVFVDPQHPGALGDWLLRVKDGLDQQDLHWPFLGLGTDWLAFGHIVIGLGFIGLWIDPLRNEWLVTWGTLACLLLLPWAWGFGALRGIPWGWRLIDCSFGLGGLVPLYLIYREIQVLKRTENMHE